MTDYVIVENSPSSLQQRRVVLYLENDALEHRAHIFRVPIDTDVDAHVQSNFNDLFTAASPITNAAWNEETDKDDVRDKAALAIEQINADIATLDGPPAPTNAQVVQIVRRILILERKIIRYLASLS